MVLRCTDCRRATECAVAARAFFELSELCAGSMLLLSPSAGTAFIGVDGFEGHGEPFEPSFSPAGFTKTHSGRKSKIVHIKLVISGRPSGSRNHATLLAEQLLEHEAEPLIRQVVNLAKKGNIHTLCASSD